MGTKKMFHTLGKSKVYFIFSCLQFLGNLMSEIFAFQPHIFRKLRKILKKTLTAEYFY